MKKFLLFTVLMALVLGGFSVQTAIAATKYNLAVTNHTNDTLIINLVETDVDSPKEYKFVIDRFSDNVKELPKGTYTYEYEYCKGVMGGKLKLKDDVRWVIYPCGIVPSKMRINSHFSQNITVSMYGPLELREPGEENIAVELGGNPVADILSGHYIMSYEAACSTVGTDPKTVFSEEVRVLKNGSTHVTLHGCEWYTHPARTYDKPVPVKFKIINHASFPIILQVVGPEGALFEISPGTNLVTLIYGTYKYGYFLDGEYHTGYMMVTRNGLGQVILRPSHIFELPSSGDSGDSGE